MRLAMDQDRPTLQSLTVAIVQSPIVVDLPAKPALRLPAGFDAVDAAVLDWIAAEGRRLGRSFVRM